MPNYGLRGAESISFGDRQHAPGALGRIATRVIGAKATEINHGLTKDFLEGAVAVAGALSCASTALVKPSTDSGRVCLTRGPRPAHTESMGTGTLHGASQPKTIIDDGERHTVFITIWESDT